MKIVWDEPKRLANLEDHHLDFANLAKMRWFCRLTKGAGVASVNTSMT